MAPTLDLFLSQVGLRITRRRQQLGWTQRQLAEKAEMKPSQIAHLELGQANFTMRTMWRIAEALDTTPEYLLLGPLKGEDGEG